MNYPKQLFDAVKQEFATPIREFTGADRYKSYIKFDTMVGSEFFDNSLLQLDRILYMVYEAGFKPASE